MKLIEKYLLNSLLSVAPRCALLPTVVGAYNIAYTVRGSARPSPIFCSRWSQKHRIRWNVIFNHPAKEILIK